MKRHASPTEKINAASRKIPRLSPGQAFAWKARKAAVWLLLSSALIAAPANAQNTAVTYQGRVQVGDTDFSGDGQFKFALVTGTNTAAQATATAVLSGQFVVGYNITFGGSGYVSPPAVTLSGGGGSGATAHAIISDGAVVEIVADTAGSGYTSPPTVTIDPPPPSIVYTTHWSNDGTSVDLATTQGTDYRNLGYGTPISSFCMANVPYGSNGVLASPAPNTLVNLRLAWNNWGNGAEMVIQWQPPGGGPAVNIPAANLYDPSDPATYLVAADDDFSGTPITAGSGATDEERRLALEALARLRERHGVQS